MRGVSGLFALAAFTASIQHAVAFEHQVGGLLISQCWHERILVSVNKECTKFPEIEYVESIGYKTKEADKITMPPNEPDPEGRWSFKPICTRVLEEIKSPMCIYTNRSFADGRGVTVFTTPKISEEVAKTLGSLDTRRLAELGINDNDGPWFNDEIEGKGIGIRAASDIKRGDRLMAYTPVFVALKVTNLTVEEREIYYRKALSQLPGDTLTIYLGLAKMYKDPRILAQDIVKANAFEMIMDEKTHYAVVPEPSRFNHDCAPSTQWYVASNQFAHFVHAVRDIPAEEEITTPYANPFKTTEARRKLLEDSFGFTCMCDRCRAGKLSDAVLTEILRIHTVLNNWDRDSMATPELAETLIDLYQKHGYESFMGDAYGFAALRWNAVGNAEKAKHYAKLTVDSVAMQDGPGTHYHHVFQSLLKKPKKHWSWRAKWRT